MSENKCLTYAQCAEFACCKDIISYVSAEDFNKYLENTPKAIVKEVSKELFALIVCWAGGIRDAEINTTLVTYSGYLQSLPDVIFCDFRKYDRDEIKDGRAVGKIGLLINKTCLHVMEGVGCDLYGPPDKRPEMCKESKIGGEYCNYSREKLGLPLIRLL